MLLSVLSSRSLIVVIQLEHLLLCIKISLAKGKNFEAIQPVVVNTYFIIKFDTGRGASS